MAVRFLHVAPPSIDAVAVDQIRVQRFAAVDPRLDLIDQLGHVLGVGEDRYLQHAFVRGVAGNRFLQLLALQAYHAVIGVQARGDALCA